MKKFPKLYHKGKGGKLYSVEIWVDGDTVFSLAGTDDGKKIQSSRVCTPKNVGRANTTTAEEQALLESAAMHKLKLDRKYSLTPESAVETQQPSPMLAQNYFKRIDKDVKFPCDTQFKLDGMRFMAMWEDDHVVLMSRGNKKITAPKHIIAELEKVLPLGYITDGEGFQKDIPFQQLMSLCKKAQPDTIKLEYHLYDILVDSEDTSKWSERRNNLSEFFKNNPNLKHIKHVESVTVDNHEEVMAEHEKAVAAGYEGLIVRNFDGVYEFSYRSYNLLKVKSFDDGEFLTIGIERGVGKFSNVGIFICQTKDGKQFKAVPKATQEVKEAYLRDKDKWIGKMATIEYFGVSLEGIPRFPILKGFRPESDLGDCANSIGFRPEKDLPK